MKIVEPQDGEIATECQCKCGCRSKKGELIHTMSHTNPNLTLCRRCYNRAGSTVR